LVFLCVVFCSLALLASGSLRRRAAPATLKEWMIKGIVADEYEADSKLYLVPGDATNFPPVALNDQVLFMNGKDEPVLCTASNTALDPDTKCVSMALVTEKDDERWEDSLQERADCPAYYLSCVSGDADVQMAIIDIFKDIVPISVRGNSKVWKGVFNRRTVIMKMLLAKVGGSDDDHVAMFGKELGIMKKADSGEIGPAVYFSSMGAGASGRRPIVLMEPMKEGLGDHVLNTEWTTESVEKFAKDLHAAFAELKSLAGAADTKVPWIDTTSPNNMMLDNHDKIKFIDFGFGVSPADMQQRIDDFKPAMVDEHEANFFFHVGKFCQQREF